MGTPHIGFGPPLFFLIILLSTLSSLSIARDTVTPDQPLADNETLISAGGSFALGFFSPNSSRRRYVGIWHNNIPTRTIVWVANRASPINGSSGILSITTGGSLSISDQSSAAAVWSAGAAGVSDPVALLLDDGNFVVKEATGGPESFAWQSFDHPTDTLLPGMKMGVNRKTGLNLNLTAWKSEDDPSPGEYVASMDPDGDPESFLWAGSKKIWRTGPWNGIQFSGIPDTVTYQYFTYSFVNNESEVSYSFNTKPSTPVISRLSVNYSGVIERSLWLADAGEWNVIWYAPRDQCDATVSPCGPFGVCNPNDSPACACLPGFRPKVPANWALRDGADGCVRDTALDCKNGTDGFAPVTGAKLPDTTNCTVDTSMSLDECKAACLKNCSCTAYASASVVGGGSGCILWVSELTDLRVYMDSGQDLYVRLAAADLDHLGSHKSGHAPVGVIVSIALVTLLLASVGCWLWIRKKRRRVDAAMLATTSFSDHRNEEEGARENDLELPLFDLGTIVAATDNFAVENKLGEGGFGPVYKGMLGDGQEVAVKRLGKTSMQGLPEFENEMLLIAKLQHRNLVRLLGCCTQGGERILIYEYMANKSLDAFLFDKAKSVLLDWRSRYRIIEGIARGLVYLHRDSRFRIIHRDLKASNILLDAEMNPKISDFGMARIFGGDETQVNTRRVVGTYGYMSPEYAMDGIFSVKSDVFSFGVLVLEIISGKKNRGVHDVFPAELNLIANAWRLWREGKSFELVDRSMGHPIPVSEVLKCIKVGLLCVQERPEDRPLMSSVVMMLGSDGSFLPNPKKPGFATRRNSVETESSSSKQDSLTSNDMTITMVDGR